MLRSARDEAPEDAAVLRELARLHADAGRPADRVEVLEALLPKLPSEERAPLHRDAASLLLGPLCDPGRAADH